MVIAMLLPVNDHVLVMSLSLPCVCFAFAQYSNLKQTCRGLCDIVAEDVHFTILQCEKGGHLHFVS